MRTMALVGALLLTAAWSATAQESKNPTPTPDRIGTAQSDKADKDTNVVYGRIKEVKAGEKIVIDIEKGLDKTYNLADPNTTIHLADDLSVGARVKIMEHGKKGNKSVQIVRDVREDTAKTEQDGAKTPQAE